MSSPAEHRKAMRAEGDPGGDCSAPAPQLPSIYDARASLLRLPARQPAQRYNLARTPPESSPAAHRTQESLSSTRFTKKHGVNILVWYRSSSGHSRRDSSSRAKRLKRCESGRGKLRTDRRDKTSGWQRSHREASSVVGRAAAFQRSGPSFRGSRCSIGSYARPGMTLRTNPSRARHRSRLPSSPPRGCR